MVTRLINIAKIVGCVVGLLPHCVMMETLTAGQFGIFDTVMNAEIEFFVLSYFTLTSCQFHFQNPNADK